MSSDFDDILIAQKQIANLCTDFAEGGGVSPQNTRVLELYLSSEQGFSNCLSDDSAGTSAILVRETNRFFTEENLKPRPEEEQDKLELNILNILENGPNT